MTTFDAPSREVCTIRRIRTNTPLQALVTLNDPVYVEAAQGLARRIVARRRRRRVEDRVVYGFSTAVWPGRPTAEEMRAIVRCCYERARDGFARQPKRRSRWPPIRWARPRATRTWPNWPPGPWWRNVLLNLDEFLTKR